MPPPGEIVTGTGDDFFAPNSMNFSAPEGFPIDKASEILRQKAMAYQRAYKVPFDEAVRAVSAQGQR
ncbi:hypothetical protein CCP2SC5_1220009 [Azospirillaceae bacterium]